MNKMQMAHDMALELVKIKPSLSAWQIADRCFEYADAMQAEADERNKAEAEKKRNEVRDILNDANTFIEREGQHFDDVNECEVDWRLAPKGAYKYKTSNDRAVWFVHDGTYTREVLAPSFGFTGSHIVDRPQ